MNSIVRLSPQNEPLETTQKEDANTSSSWENPIVREPAASHEVNLKNYIFILSPPFSGSTLLWKLLATSSSVSCLPTEGQFIPEVKKIMRDQPWNPSKQLPWAFIKNSWHHYWDNTKNFFLEKSPPHLFQAQQLTQHFSPTYFFILARDPYANCEGIMRRRKWRTGKSAIFIMECLRQQMNNAKNLPNSLALTYEALVLNTEHILEKIHDFLPEFGKLDIYASFKIHSIEGTQERKIVSDLNLKKIANLSPLQLCIMNRVFHQHADVMSYWGYSYFYPSWNHLVLFLKTKLANLLNVLINIFKGQSNNKINNSL